MNQPRKRKKWLLPVVFCLLLLGVTAGIALWPPAEEQTSFLRADPVLTVETPQKIRASDTEEFVLDVSVSDLGDTLYPAASMSIGFDQSRLEFLGVREGNVFVHDDASVSGQTLPQWSVNIENSNETGQINIMYLDLTGGRYAFDRQLLAEKDNVVLRLAFRLRGSVRPGDVLEISLQDAVFAASDETQSLAMTTGTLCTQNSKVVIGE